MEGIGQARQSLTPHAKISAEVLRMHLDYSAWASARLLDAVAALPAAGLARDFGTADKTVIGTLAHIYGGDRVWLARVRGDAPQGLPGSEIHDLPRLREAWVDVQADWKAWAAPLKDEDFQQAIAYRDLKGNPWITPLWQVVLHVVNHASHHRGQAAGFLRTLGHTPPPLDLIAYYRSMP
jgi:uncharacterized damage-inducible protein DinB